MQDDRFVKPAGEKIRQLRQDHFWTQEQLADAAGLRKRTVERAEAGQRLQRSTVQALAQALGCPPDALVQLDRPVAAPQVRSSPVVRGRADSSLASPAMRERMPQRHGSGLVWRDDGEPMEPSTDSMAPLRQALHPIPPSLENAAETAAVVDRLAQFPPTTQALLRLAAVIGGEVPLHLMQAVIGLPLAGLSPDLTQVQTAGWLVEVQRSPETLYTFAQASVQRVIYETLPQEQRCVLHAQVMEALAKDFPDRLADMAYHALHAKVWDKAAVHYRQAAGQSYTQGAFRQASGYFEHALMAAGHLPEDDDSHKLSIDLHVDLGRVLVILGDLQRALPLIHKAASHAEHADDGRRLGGGCALLSLVHWLVGDYRRAVAFGRRAAAIAEVLRDNPARISARLTEGQVALALGDHAQAQTSFQQNLTDLEWGSSHDCLGMPALPAVLSRTWLGWTLAELGAFAEGQVHCEEALHVAEAAKHSLSLAIACYGAGLVSLYRGDYLPATDYLERGMALCQRESPLVWLPWIAACLGAAYSGCGRLAEGISYLEQAVADADQMGVAAYQARSLAWLGEAYLMMGRLVEALEFAERALTLARELREPASEGQALLLHADIAAQTNPPARETVEEAYHQAQALADRLGLRRLLAHCHLGLGMFYTSLDERGQTRRELSLAAELFRSMNMAS